jgi:hypothetical protein
MQRDAGRIIMRLPSRQHGRFADDAIWGEYKYKYKYKIYL